jgi:hypothetical protein
MLSILLCSLDSFLASLGIGLIESSAINRRRLVAAFALCDCLGTIVGASLRLGMAPMRPGGLGLTLASLLFSGVALGVMVCSRRLPSILFAIPILLSLDNFLTGLLDGSIEALSSAWIAGVASGLLAGSGFAAASVVRTQFSRARAFAVSVAMITVAFLYFN